jgi:hypothetical protein
MEADSMMHAVEHEERPKHPPQGMDDPDYFDTNEFGPQSERPPYLTEEEQALEDEAEEN